jgi:hypothetical protein
MDIDTFNGHKVSIGICNGCGSRKVLVDYNGDYYCTRCIENDDHLSSVIGWKRY